MNTKKITDLIAMRGLNQRKVAGMLGITPTGLNHIVIKGSTNTATIERLAEILGVSPAVFFDDAPVAHTTDGPCHECRTKDDIIALLRDNLARADSVIEMLRGSPPHERAVNQ